MEQYTLLRRNKIESHSNDLSNGGSRYFISTKELMSDDYIPTIEQL